AAVVGLAVAAAHRGKHVGALQRDGLADADRLGVGAGAEREGAVVAAEAAREPRTAGACPLRLDRDAVQGGGARAAIGLAVAATDRIVDGALGGRQAALADRVRLQAAADGELTR